MLKAGQAAAVHVRGLTRRVVGECRQTEGVETKEEAVFAVI